jgi:two-component system invasion response regulator UvrY
VESTSDTRHQSEVTVITVDDHAGFRQVANDVIARTPGFEPVGEAGSGEEALRLVGEVAPALVLLDLHMPGMDGVETARQLASARPDSTIVLITIEDPQALPRGVASCGAAAVARKQDFCPRMLRRLWDVHGPSQGSS